MEFDSFLSRRRALALSFSTILSVGIASTVPSASASESESFDTITRLDTKNKTTQHSPMQDILSKSFGKAMGGGKAGAAAAVVQVSSLMWLRTAMNYQYRYGGSLSSSLQTLWSQGGIQRLYQGLPFALLQGPFTRFGDTAANVGTLAFLQEIFPASSSTSSSTSSTFIDTVSTIATTTTATTTTDITTPIMMSLSWIFSSLPVQTACGSILAGLWRIVLMPIDTSKTVLQVEGSEGLQKLWDKVKRDKSPSAFYQGSLASAAATAVGHYPWFLTYNYLNQVLLLPQVSTVTPMNEPTHDNILLFLALGRSALIGFIASCVSDTVSNSLRVIKTTKQTASMTTMPTTVMPDSEAITNDVSSDGVEKRQDYRNHKGELSYPDTVRLIVKQDGWIGLFGRGLQTRLLTNAIQGAVFSVLWKYFQQQ